MTHFILWHKFGSTGNFICSNPTKIDANLQGSKSVKLWCQLFTNNAKFWQDENGAILLCRWTSYLCHRTRDYLRHQKKKVPPPVERFWKSTILYSDSMGFKWKSIRFCVTWHSWNFDQCHKTLMVISWTWSCGECRHLCSSSQTMWRKMNLPTNKQNTTSPVVKWYICIKWTQTEHWKTKFDEI